MYGDRVREGEGEKLNKRSFESRKTTKDTCKK